ncbi:hypothetical protein THAOC_09736 [Thalassiosira oceanica]|uniref:Uncharacterized protein n=1 Tax=Thalassiosira oceanica TaxID=159749 RepID=K0TET0_THAOC|nr:hypothetical protein THAOC_09736 [Thalassiosira oceanica]|eukprot:EJK69047.1 hypothetical protein THAOC_09736 [Thalassiosira oceanica]
MWPGGFSVPQGQMLYSLNQSSGALGSGLRQAVGLLGPGSPILEQGALVRWELSTGGSLPSPISEGLVTAAAAHPAYQFDQQLCSRWGCRGGSSSLNKSSGQRQLHHSSGWVHGSSSRRRKHIRAASRLIALLARFHPLVAVAQLAVAGSKAAAKFHSAGCPIQPPALVAGGVSSVGSSPPAQLDRQLRWTLARWRGTRSDAQRLGRQRLDKQHR